MKIFVAISAFLVSLSTLACLEGVNDYGFKCYEVSPDNEIIDKSLLSCNADLNLASAGFFKRCLQDKLAKGEKGIEVIDKCKAKNYKCSLIKIQPESFTDFKCNEFLQMAKRDDLSLESVIKFCKTKAFGD